MTIIGSAAAGPSAPPSTDGGSSGRGVAVDRGPAWPFALPALVALSLILVYPLSYALWLSMHVDRLSENDGTFVWFDNYIAVLQRGELVGTIGRTLVFTLGSIVLQFIVGFAAALALQQFPRGSRVMRPLMLAPWIIPGVAVAAVWRSILNPVAGFANSVVDMFGMDPVPWLSSPSYAMGSLILVNTWKSFPFWMLMISAGLQSIPREVVDAARVDGAGPSRVVWHVILPGLRPILFTTALLAFIWTFNYFDLVYLLTQGGPNGATTTLPYAIWESSLKFSRFDQGAVYSVLSILLTGFAILFYIRVTRKASNS